MKAQSLEVTPDSVVCVLGEPVQVKWTLVKNQTYRIFNTRLYLGKKVTREQLLIRGMQPLNKQDLATKIFGENIKAKFQDPFYYLTFNECNVPKKITVTLVVNVEVIVTLETRPALSKSVEIVPERGMIFF